MTRISLLVLLGSLFMATAANGAAALPDPYAHADHPIIGPVPEPVTEQVFWVELPVPPETRITAMAPADVTLLDQTKPAKGRTRTRLYFRAAHGVVDGKILIKIEGRDIVTVPLRVLTYREDVERQLKAVPGLDPAARKRGRSYYTDAMIEQAKANAAAYPALKRSLERPTPYDKLDDDALFAALPSWSVPRQIYSNWPCPYCGEVIYRHSGFYPWKFSSAVPWKATCPDCKRTFPTNDYAHDDFTSGDFPDDGWGWDPGSGKREDFAGWIGYWNHRVLWEQLGGNIERLALRYLILGDEAAAHRAAVLLCRMAYVYPGMNTRWQQVKMKYSRPGRLLVDGNWERNSVLVPVCQAYDALFDYIGRDERLVAYLATKDEAIRSPADVRALIDTNLLQVFGWDWVRRELSGGNMGAREEDMAQFAVCADMGAVSDRWIEEIFTHAYNSGANRGGFDDEVFVNHMTREGPCSIGALAYAYGYLASKSDMAEILRRVASPQWQARCNLYDPRLYPKFRAEFDTWVDFVVAGQFAPSFGDNGKPPGRPYPHGIPADLREAYERAYREWPTDKLARALYRLGRRPPGLFDEDIWPRVEAHVARVGPAPPLQSRVMDGVGFAFLESRPDAPDLKDRAGLALRYGYGWGHSHHDNLNIEFFARGLSLTPELGYPCWTHPMGGTGHAAHHLTGTIDRRSQYQGSTTRGDLEMFASAPEASFVEVSARPDGFPNRVYRRAVCLADAPGGNVYAFDVMRLAGGGVRTWCFHGPACDGKLASDLAFAPATGDKGFTNNIVDLQRAVSDGDAWADWSVEGSDARLRVQFAGVKGRRYLTARCAKTDVPPIRYLFAEDEAADGASEFVSLWQPYAGKPFIEKIERLPVAGAKAGEFAPAAVRVTLAGGQVDTFLYTFDTETPLRCGDLEFQGRFGYWSERNGKLRALHLVDAARLCRGDEGVREAPASFRARVASVDYAAGAVTLDQPLPADLDATGTLAYIRAGEHRSAYHVTVVTADRTTLRPALTPLIFRSQVREVAADGSHLVCEVEPPIETNTRFRFKPGYYNGAALTGEDGRATYRVVRVDKDRVYCDRALDAADFPDADGDGRRMVKIYDIGPGDEVTFRRSIFRASAP